MAWSPQRSKHTYAPIRSAAYARTHGGFEPPPDPTGRVVYAVCSRRRRIFRFDRNDQNGQLSLFAQREPLYGVSYPSRMGFIDGDSTGAWYAEYVDPTSFPFASQVDPDPIAQIPFFNVSNNNTWPFLHRLDAGLNLVASYIFLYYGAFAQYYPWGNLGYVGGGGGRVVGVGSWAPPEPIVSFNDPPAMIDIDTLLSQPGAVMQNGKTTAKLLNWQQQGPFTATPVSVVGTDQGVGPTGQIPNDAIGGKANVIYGSSAFGPNATRVIARWDNGILTAQKTAADVFTHPTNPGLSDTVEAQSIGGSSGICYTTAYNNAIIVRNGALQVTRTFFRPELDALIGPTPSPTGGVITGFNFVGIGGS